MYVTAFLIICTALEVGVHHRASEPEENKIISLSDGPVRGFQLNLFSLGYREVDAGSRQRVIWKKSTAEASWRGRGAPATHLLQVRSEERRAGP